MPESPEGIEYRNLGTMEKNVDIFAKRMKGSKSWSEKGVERLSKIIALKLGQGFKDKVAALISGKVSERVTERFEETILSSKAVLKKTIIRAVYPLHKGQIPFTNCKMTNSRKVIQRMFDYRPFSEMIYR
ncbi:MAG: hypothetical protein ACOX7R_09060 [Acetivibrionales bacterium]